MHRASKTFKERAKCFSGIISAGEKLILFNECENSEPQPSLEPQTKTDSSSKRKVCFFSQCNYIVNIGKFKVLLSKIEVGSICKDSISIHISNRLVLNENFVYKMKFMYFLSIRLQLY